MGKSFCIFFKQVMKRKQCSKDGLGELIRHKVFALLVANDFFIEKKTALKYMAYHVRQKLKCQYSLKQGLTCDYSCIVFSTALA